MEELSIEIFGTPDYASVLEVMSPHDALVKEFLYRSGELERPAVVVAKRVKLWRDDRFG